MATEAAPGASSGPSASKVSSGRMSMADLIKGMPDLHGGPDTGSSDKTAADAAKTSEAPVADPSGSPASEPAAGAKETPPVEAKPDADTTKRLGVVAKAEAKAREEATQRKIELDRREQALLARENEATGKGSTLEQLKALIRKDPVKALETLGLTDEADLSVAAQRMWAQTAGKADPKNKAYAEQTARERELQSELAELKKTTAELAEQFKTRDQRAAAEQFANRYLDEAVKAIPSEPSLIGTRHTKNPANARAALLSLGQEMEKDADGETPSHGEVIAEYEKRRRAEFEEQGVDVDAMLKAKVAAPVAADAKKPAATLDVTSGGAVRAVDRSKMTEQQKRDAMLKDMPWDRG